MLERYSSPFRVGKYPQGASPTVISELEDAMAKLGVDAYAVMHEDAQIEFINALQGDAIHGKSFIEYMDREISIAVLGHAGASEGTPGKLGNENMAGDLRQDLLEADAKQLMATINSQLVRYYVELNYGMDLSLPKFKLNFEPPADLQAEADKDSKILSLGLSTSKKHLRDKYNLPEPEDDEDEFAVVQSATAPPLSAHDQRHALLASDTARRQVKTVDDLNAARKKKVIAPFAESPKSSKASSVSGHHMGLRPRS
jgi:phage gp29-like protein